jgi:hypothetical protein
MKRASAVFRTELVQLEKVLDTMSLDRTHQCSIVAWLLVKLTQEIGVSKERLLEQLGQVYDKGIPEEE